VKFRPQPLYPRERTPMPIVYEAWRVSVPVWTFRRREKLLLLPRIEPRIFQAIVIYAVYVIRVHFKINLAEGWYRGDSSDSGSFPEARSCEHSDESAGSLKIGEFYHPAEQLPTFQEGLYLIHLI